VTRTNKRFPLFNPEVSLLRVRASGSDMTRRAELAILITRYIMLAWPYYIF